MRHFNDRLMAVGFPRELDGDLMPSVLDLNQSVYILTFLRAIDTMGKWASLD